MNHLIISNTQIRQNADGMYLLNDLHKASGYEERHSPKYFLKSVQAKEIIKELFEGGIPPSKSVRKVGTYACKTLAYAYAMWVSAKFAVHVIQTYDRVVMTEHDKLSKAQNRLKRAVVKDSNCISVVFNERRNNATHALFKAMERLGLVRIITKLRPVYKKEITELGWRYCSGYTKDGTIRIKPEMHKALIDMVKKALDGNNLEVFS